MPENGPTRFRDTPLDFKWLAGILITVLFSLIGYTLSHTMAELEAQKAADRAIEMRVNTNAAHIDTNSVLFGNISTRLQEGQDRDHRLLIQIAKKMGILVGE